MRRLLFALPAAVLLAGCVGTPADAPMEPTQQQDRAPTVLPQSAHAQYGVPAPFYNGKQSLPVAGTTSLTSVVIDFESLASTDASFTYVSTYSEDGFTLVNESDPTGTEAFGSPQSGNTAFYDGSTALVNNQDFGVTLLTKDDGGTFNAESIDLAELWPLGEGPREVPFTGTRADGSTVTVTFTTDGVRGFQTFTFAGFTDLVSLSWVQVPQYHQFDNIVLSIGTVDPQPQTGTVDKAACMHGAWEKLGFKNQGQCVRYVETNKDSR